MKAWERVYEHLADSRFAQKIHGIFTIFWLITSFPLVILFGNIVVFVSWLSVYAIVVAHWSSWQAARTEVAQTESDQKMHELLTSVHELVVRLRKMDPDHPEGSDGE